MNLPSIPSSANPSPVAIEYRDGRMVASKSVPFSAANLRELESGLKLQGHPNIIKIWDYSISERDIRTVMELHPQTVLDVIRGYPEGLPLHRLHHIFRQVLSGVRHIHCHNLVHQDLKLENILIDPEDRIYIIDFGFTKPFNGRLKSYRSDSGSILYAAPEVWLGATCYGPEIDVWSLGVCLFVLASSCFPFGGATVREIWRDIRKGLTRLPKSISRNPLLADLISKMLLFDSESRIRIH